MIKHIIRESAILILIITVHIIRESAILILIITVHIIRTIALIVVGGKFWQGTVMRLPIFI